MPIDRRDLLSTAGLFGFTLAVDARHLIQDDADDAAESPAPRSVPTDGPTVTAQIGEEPNMHKVDHEVELANVEGNYQRLRKHTLDPVELRAVRLHVSATNGSDTVRVFEIRCF